MNPLTLSQLADIGAKAAHKRLADIQDDGGYLAVSPDRESYVADAQAREAFVQAVLDAVGYKFPVDPEREAFDAWIAEQGDGFMPCGSADKAFDVWKAGRDNLRSTFAKTAVSADASAKQAETFEAHGYTWFKHTKGVMPCDGEAVVQILMNAGGGSRSWGTVGRAKQISWEQPILGWRYADSTALIAIPPTIVATTKPPLETFTAHGHTWFKHTPGDPMPVAGDVKVNYVLDHELKEGAAYKADTQRAEVLSWGEEDEDNWPIIGWRYADADS